MTETPATAESAEMDLRQALASFVESEPSEASFSDVARFAFRDDRRLRELDVALEDWDAVASSLGATKSVANTLRGYLYQLRGRLAPAVEAVKGEKSQSPWACCIYAKLLLRQGQVAAAARVIDDGRKKFADFVPLVYAKVGLLWGSGQEEEARKELENAKPDAGSAAWHVANARVLECSGEYREAITSYREAVKIDDENTEARFRLGFLLDLYGSPAEEAADEAVKAYEACLKIVPLNTNAVINLGLLYEDRERYHDAIKCYEVVLRAYPDHRRARLYLGDAQAATEMFYDRDQEKKADRHSQVLKIPVTDFELSVRSRNCLQKMNIETLGDLIMKTEQELLSYKNFGETSLTEIRDMLNQKSLRLGQGLEDKGREPPSGRNPLEATAPPDVLNRPIDDLNLSVRSRRCMERLEVLSVRELINKTEVELMSAKNFGMTSLNEIKRELGEIGLHLRS